MNWSDYEERFGESREDFAELDEDIEYCPYCGCELTEMNTEIEEYKYLGRDMKNKICYDCKHQKP